jgi:transposase-like protein
MATTTRRAFTDEVKREAVSLLEGSGRPLTQVAVELGIQPSMLRSWREWTGARLWRPRWDGQTPRQARFQWSRRRSVGYARNWNGRRWSVTS